MLLKKIIGKLHLWLGISSGLLVFVIAITGCLYAFQDELQNLTQSYRFVVPQDKNFILPSTVRTIADKELPGKHIHAVLYKGKDHAVQAIYYSFEKKYYDVVYINPYHGEVQKVKDLNTGFFPFILEGHFYLWLPPEVGQPVVASATLVFLFMLFSGLYLWWKRKKGQKLKIKWDARWRRKNYDLHNVLGFYVFAVALIFAVTGLVWGFEWFSRSYYAVLSGGQTAEVFYDPCSDTTVVSAKDKLPAIDRVWLKLVKEYPRAAQLEVHIPENYTGSIAANANPDAVTYWKTDYRYFDQYTLKELNVKHKWGRSEASSGADLLMKMNYDIHTGAVWGLPGKVLAFFASLLVASLPVTGSIIWWGRKKKEKRALKSSGYNFTKAVS